MITSQSNEWRGHMVTSQSDEWKGHMITSQSEEWRGHMITSQSEEWRGHMILLANTLPYYALPDATITVVMLLRHNVKTLGLL